MPLTADIDERETDPSLFPTNTETLWLRLVDVSGRSPKSVQHYQFNVKIMFQPRVGMENKPDDYKQEVCFNHSPLGQTQDDFTETRSGRLVLYDTQWA